MLANMHWEEKPLGSLCELINGYAFKPSDWESLGRPIIRIQNLNGGQDFNFFQGLLPERYEVKTGTLLFAWSGNRGTSFGPFIWKGPNGFLNQHIFKVIPNDDVDEKWFYFALDDVRQRVERNAHGAIGLVHVRKQDLCKYIIPVPKNYSEQHAIAAILDTVDEAIRRTEALLAKLRQVKAGMLHDLLTCGIDDNGEIRDPIRHPEQFRDSPLGMIPATWDLKTLEDITEMSAPICYGIVQVREHVPNGIPVLAIRDLHGDYLTDINRTVAAIDQKYARSRVQFNDVLISIKGTIGRIGVVPVFFKGNISRDIARVRPINLVRSRFLFYLLSSPLGQNVLELAKVGTTRAELSIAPLKLLSFAFPPVEEQLHIEKILDGEGQLIEDNQKELLKIGLLKQGLMQELLTGRVRVPDSIIHQQTEVEAQ